MKGPGGRWGSKLMRSFKNTTINAGIEKQFFNTVRG